MFQNAANEPDGVVGEVSVAAFLVEYVFAALVKHHMKVHPVASLVVHRFRHKGCGKAIVEGGAADDVLHHHGVVTNLGERQQFGLDLLLRAETNLMVVIAHLDPLCFHCVHHLLTDFIEAVEGGVHVVAFAFLLSHSIIIIIIKRQCVLALGGAYSISAGELSAVEFHSVEKMEFQLRNPGAVVGNTGGKHEIMRPEGHAAGILLHPDAGVGFAD